MKILQINTVYEVASTGRTTKELNDYLNENNNTGLVAIATGESNDKVFKFGISTETRLHSLLSRITGKQGYYSYFSTRKLLKYIKTTKPNVVHLRVLHSNCINLNTLLEYLGNNNIATVVTLHDCWFFTGKCHYYTSANCSKWQTGCGGCVQLKKDNVSWFLDRTKQMWSDKQKLFEAIDRLAVIGVSDWITNEAKRSFLSTAKIVQRIYNWIDLSEFYPKKNTEIRNEFGLENSFVVLCVASNWILEDRKGLSKIIELARKIDEEWKILLVGNISNKVKLPKNIVSVGSVKETFRLVELYSSVDVFLNLSIEETFGKVTAEALSCGTPVVTIDSTANSELVPEYCGYVCPNLDLNSILKSLSKININGKAFYSDNCRKFAQENFEKNNNIAQYLDVYTKLVLEK